jgi:predicted secreted protein
MSSGISGKGTKLTWDTVDIAELSNISGPSQSADTIDLTSHDSADSYREFVAGLRDGGEISFDGNLITTDSTGQIAMHTDFQAGSTKVWIIKFPAWVTSSHEYPQITGSGICTGFEVSFPDDDKISISGKIKVTGKPTLTVS